MNMNVENLDEHRPMTPIADLRLYEKKDGTFILAPIWASEEFIESHKKISQRFAHLQQMAIVGSGFLGEEAERYKKDKA